MHVFPKLSTFLSGGTSGSLTTTGNLLQKISLYMRMLSPMLGCINRWPFTFLSRINFVGWKFQLIILCMFLLQRFMGPAAASVETGLDAETLQNLYDICQQLFVVNGTFTPPMS